MGWWIALGVLVLLAILPLGASILYDEAGVRVNVIIGPIRFTVFPVKKKVKKPQQAQSEKQEPEQPNTAAAPAKPQHEAAKPAQEEKKEPAGGSLMDFLPLVELALKFVGDFFGKTLHIDVLYLKLTMAADDPADLAINYGRAWAALGNLWPKIDDLLTIKKRDIRLQCDFEASQTLVNARVDITLTLGRLLGLVLGYGCRILFRFLKILDKRKKAAAQTNP